MMAVAEASLGDSERCGKIFCRPKIAFLRENLVRRVAPRSLQFSASTFGRGRRAPTNEGCRRGYPVHSDAWPDNREFLEREKRVEGLASTHLGLVVRFSKRRALLFPRLDVNTNCYIFAGRANFAFSSENALAPRRSLCAPERESALDSRIQRGQFCPSISANIRCRCRGDPVRSSQDNFVHAPTVLWHAD